MDLLRPQCVSSVAAQFGQTIRRFSSRLSVETPFTWSRINDMWRPFQFSACPHNSHARRLSPAS
jgi:hypothetical protein